MEEMYLTKEEIMDVITKGIEDFIEKIAGEGTESAKINITIEPGEITIAMKKNNIVNNNLEVKFN